MKQKSIKIQFALAMLMLTSYVTRAQNQLIVTLTNGQTDAFNVSDIRSVKFVNNTMNLMENNGSQSSWNIGNVSQYAFSGASSIVPTNGSISDQERIFPNPVSDNLNVEYWSLRAGKISIELLDLNGKVVRTVFEGTHQGKQTYTWTKDLPGGYYLCHIVSASKSITKPFVIQ
jgi:hypothetical protein